MNPKRDSEYKNTDTETTASWSYFYTKIYIDFKYENKLIFNPSLLVDLHLWNTLDLKLHGRSYWVDHLVSPIRVWFVWGRFYGISTIVGYTMPNSLYTYISNINDLVWLGFMTYQQL